VRDIFICSSKSQWSYGYSEFCLCHEETDLRPSQIRPFLLHCPWVLYFWGRKHTETSPTHLRLTHCVVTFTAGHTTSDEQLEEMLESGNPEIFTQGVSRGHFLILRCSGSVLASHLQDCLLMQYVEISALNCLVLLLCVSILLLKCSFAVRNCLFSRVFRCVSQSGTSEPVFMLHSTITHLRHSARLNSWRNLNDQELLPSRHCPIVPCGDVPTAFKCLWS